jgi:hypothetical protein
MDLGSILALHKKQFMPVPRTTTAIESIVIHLILDTSQLKSLMLRQHEELPNPQSGFADSLRVAPTTMLRGRGVNC